MSGEFERTSLLLGNEALKKLKRSHVAVFGIGGVGGHAADALIRSGIGKITLVDNDIVSLSNINRQLVATHNTIGLYKVDVMSEHAYDINPDIEVMVYKTFVSTDTADQFDFSCYDYIIDAIDTVSSKIMLVERAISAGTPIISSMGAGNKLDPTRFEVDDIYKTSVCPLARVMRRELKKRGIKNLKVVYSKEETISSNTIPGSTAFVPSVAGLILAGEVVKDIVGINDK